MIKALNKAGLHRLICCDHHHILPPPYLLIFTVSSLSIFAFLFCFDILSSSSNPNSSYPSINIVDAADSLDQPPPPPPPQHASSPLGIVSPPKDGANNSTCDLYTGRWVPDHDASISYTSSSCQTIPDSKNCLKNGRPTTGFLNWGWKPQGCRLPRFDAHRFLRFVTGKRLAFIGDSVARNQFESLLCLLSQAEMPVDVYKDSEDRFRTWLFPRSNFTLMIFWSPFLIHHEELVINGSNSGTFNLHVDKVDARWATNLSGIHYAVISTAHWFFRKNYLYDRSTLVGCVYCNEPNVTDLGLNFSLRMAVRRALGHINNDCKGCDGMLTMLRTFSPAHFENGAWDTGGGCNRTRPYGQDEVNRLGMSSERELRNLQVEELERARKEGKGRTFRSLDVTEAMLMRPDGHPDAYWGNKWMKGYNDCVHWCLPGPVDVWNDFLMAELIRGGGGGGEGGD